MNMVEKYQEMYGHPPGTDIELEAFTHEQRLLGNVNGDATYADGKPVPDLELKWLNERASRAAWVDSWEKQPFGSISEVPDGTRLIIAYIGDPRWRNKKGGSRNKETWGIGIILDNGEVGLATLGKDDDERDDLLRSLQKHVAPGKSIRVTKTSSSGSTPTNGKVWFIDLEVVADGTP